jgi:hypothetical protein
MVLSSFVPSDCIPGFFRWSIAGLGNATATNASIVGQLMLVFDSCAGTGLESPGSNDLRLTKVDGRPWGLPHCPFARSPRHRPAIGFR